jgi:hypothetical protein
MKFKLLLPILASLVILPSVSNAQQKDEQSQQTAKKYQSEKERTVSKASVQEKSKSFEKSKAEAKKTKAEVKKSNRSVSQNRKAHAVPTAHKREVYKTGVIVRKRPAKGITLRFGGASFIFDNGFYYRHVNNVYKVVRPPVGLRVEYLPTGYEHIIVQGRSLYFYQGIYYGLDNGGYRVIEEPSSDALYGISAVETQQTTDYELGTAYDVLPQGAQSVTISGQQYFQYQDIYFLPQSSSNGIRYLAIKLN